MRKIKTLSCPFGVLLKIRKIPDFPGAQDYKITFGFVKFKFKTQMA
jgi:hypothetical protein